jgi:spore germination protein KC
MSKKILKTLLCFVCGMLLAGCDKDVLPARGEIEEFEVMRVVGMDRSKEDPSNMEITYITESSKQSGSGDAGSGGGPKEYGIMSSSGHTLFEAQRKLKSHSDRKMFLGYVDFILIGEEAAKEDFSKYFDFLTRDHELRFSPRVFIIKDGTAKDFMRQTTSVDKYVADRLDNVKADIENLSNFDEVTVNEVISMLDDNSSTGTVIPALKAVEIKDEMIIGGKLAEQDIETSGYAVLKDFKLVGFIDESISTGYNFLISKVKSCPVSVRDQTGQYVALEVINETTKVKTHFNGGTLEGVTYDTHIYVNIDEQHSKNDIYTQEGIDHLDAALSDAIRSQMEQVLARSKEFGVDCTALGEHIRFNNPYKWERIKDRWKELYPNLKIDVRVSTDIRRTYDIEKPNGSE